MKRFKTKEFKDLQHEWYQKLKERGFEDIEQDEVFLKKWDSRYFIGKFKPETQDYYYYGEHFLGRIKDQTHKEIWRLHIQGMSTRDIAIVLGTCNKDSASAIIKQIKEMMISSD